VTPDKGLKLLHIKKTVTLAELALHLQCSPRTVQRRLADWQAINSYNRNGSFYTLPGIAKFDTNGLWRYKGAFFSRFGNLLETFIQLASNSQAGLTAAEAGELLGVKTKSFLWSLREHPALKREKPQGIYVYYSSDSTRYNAQKFHRDLIQSTAKLPRDFEAVAVLVEKIKHPDLSNEALSQLMRKQKILVEPGTIHNFFVRHDLADKKNATFNLIRCLSDYLSALFNGVSVSNLFIDPPVVEFRPSILQCSNCNGGLKVKKTHFRNVNTLHVGRFKAIEVFMTCKECGKTYRSEELCALVPPGANFGYDVIVYTGKALFLRHRTEVEVMTELAQRNVQISPREVSLLGMKFILYLAIAHQQCAPDLTADMQTRGGYICHLDATCEGRDPLLMSSIDSLSEIVLGNVKLPAEDEKHIIPFLERIKITFGIPLALVHDMGKGIIKAVAKVFPNVPDFICHFHFLRDIRKDFLSTEYDIIRNRLKKHGISAKLRYQAKQLKSAMASSPESIQALEAGIHGALLQIDSLPPLPAINSYALIQWTLRGKSEGNGYGFPFDRPHLAFTKRIYRLNADIERIEKIHLGENGRDNAPYFKIHEALKPIMKDNALRKAVEAIEEKIVVFEKLRDAMRIAMQSGHRGLNDEGHNGSCHTIENRVQKFRTWLTGHRGYTQNPGAQKMIGQIDKYWQKLFTDPITVQTPSGPIQIQPQRTNNILEQFFRALKRANRRKTGNASSSRMLRTIIADTPLVRNLEKPIYTKILFNGKASLEEVFAEINIDTLREAFRKTQDSPEKIPSKLKPLIAMSDFPEKVVAMIKRVAV